MTLSSSFVNVCKKAVQPFVDQGVIKFLLASMTGWTAEFREYPATSNSWAFTVYVICTKP